MGSPWLLLLLPVLCGGLAQEDPEYQLRLQEHVVVQKGLCARVSCSFTFPRYTKSSPLKVYWFRDGDDVHSAAPVATNDGYKQVKTETRGRFKLLGNPRDLNCSLSISNARSSDQGTYFFRVELRDEKYSYQAKKLHVQVTALTEKPAIHVPEPLVSGRPGSLICSLPGTCEQTRLQFSWVGEMLNPYTHNSRELSLSPRPQDHGRNLSCRVTLQESQETTERTIRLNVSYAPQNLTILVSFEAGSVLKIHTTSALSVPAGQTVWLLCRVDSNPPAELSWLGRSPGLNVTSPSPNMGKLELRLPEAVEDAEFTCHAQNCLGSLNVSLKLSVLTPPQLLSPSCSWEASDLRCNCSASARPAPTLHWWLNQERLQENSSNAFFQVTSRELWSNSTLSIREGFRTGLSVRCEAQNALGTQSAWVLLLPGNPEKAQWSDVLPILGAAGALALLALCLCLVAVACVVRARRNVVSAESGAVASEDPVMDSVAWGSRPDSPADQACPAAGEAQELHYANLSFHGMKAREPQNHEGPGPTEYSEIKTSK